jgi:hypothetical protein
MLLPSRQMGTGLVTLSSVAYMVPDVGPRLPSPPGTRRNDGVAVGAGVVVVTAGLGGAGKMHPDARPKS